MLKGYFESILYTEDTLSKFNKFVKNNPQVADELRKNEVAIKSYLDKNPSFDVQKKINSQDVANMITYKSKTEAKKKGIEGLVLGKDYLEFPIHPAKAAYGIQAFVPLNHKASKAIASKKVCDLEGKWCTAGNDSEHWDDYTDDGFFVYVINPTAVKGDEYEEKSAHMAKVAIHYKAYEGTVEYYDATDEEIDAAQSPIRPTQALLKKYYQKFLELGNVEKTELKKQQEILKKVFSLTEEDDDYEYNDDKINILHFIINANEFKKYEVKSVKELLQKANIINPHTNKKIIGFGSCDDDIKIINVPLENLEGLPKYADDEIIIKNTNIKNLEGLPASNNLTIQNNKQLTSLKGIGKQYSEVIIKGNTNLKEIDVYPKKISNLTIDQRFVEVALEAVKAKQIKINTINDEEVDDLLEGKPSKSKQKNKDDDLSDFTKGMTIRQMDEWLLDHGIAIPRNRQSAADYKKRLAAEINSYVDEHNTRHNSPTNNRQKLQEDIHELGNAIHDYGSEVPNKRARESLANYKARLEDHLGQLDFENSLNS